MRSGRLFISCASIIGLVIAGCSQPSASPVLSSSSKESPAGVSTPAATDSPQASDAGPATDANPVAGTKTIALAVPGMI